MRSRLYGRRQAGQAASGRDARPEGVVNGIRVAGDRRDAGPRGCQTESLGRQVSTSGVLGSRVAGRIGCVALVCFLDLVLRLELPMPNGLRGSYRNNAPLRAPRVSRDYRCDDGKTPDRLSVVVPFLIQGDH